MTLEIKICRHYDPKEYKEIFSEFRRLEPLNYQVIDTYIKDYCVGKVGIKEVYEQIGRVKPPAVLKQAYFNVIDRLVELYGTNRSTWVLS